MHSLWKGSISFGLVNIPVKMYSASQEHEFKFVLLHKKDLSQIRYARICKLDQKEVPWNEIVKGYEYKKGEFIVFNEEDFEKVNLKKTQTLETVSFANEDEIDTVYYEKPYYLEPDKNAGKTYALLRDALSKSKKVGIAKYVIHNREHLAVIKSYGNAIIVNQLRYNEELVSPKNLEIPSKTEKSNAQEMEIALKLINHLTHHFKPEEYKDTYVGELKKMIEQKAKGKIIRPKGEKPAAPTKVHDIMSLLKASLEEEDKKTARPKKSRKKSA